MLKYYIEMFQKVKRSRTVDPSFVQTSQLGTKIVSSLQGRFESRQQESRERCRVSCDETIRDKRRIFFKSLRAQGSIDSAQY